MKSAAHRQLELFIGRTLQAGVLLAALLGIAGGALYLARHGGGVPTYHEFRGEDSTLRHPFTIAAAAARGDAQGLIMLGLLVLIATPIVRVLLSVALFAIERDTIYVIITLIVLAILGWSLLGAH
jgi:uncharacterized membrane protein